jgi:hypothetical protein
MTPIRSFVLSCLIAASSLLYAQEGEPDELAVYPDASEMNLPVPVNVDTGEIPTGYLGLFDFLGRTSPTSTLSNPVLLGKVTITSTGPTPHRARCTIFFHSRKQPGSKR